jgi:hypothetical protein
VSSIVGDPLTGALPRTRLVVPQTVYGPVRQQARPVWPVVPDAYAVTLGQLRPGRIAYVRTRWGIRRYQIRTVNRSREGHNRGRTYVVGHSRRGWCRTFWTDRIASTQTTTLALGARP